MSHAHAPHIDSVDAPALPAPPPGFAACRVLGDRSDTQVTHWVLLDSRGRSENRPALCGLTRVPTIDPHTLEELIPADLPAWSIDLPGSSLVFGVSGPGIHQVVCVDCERRRGLLPAAPHWRRAHEKRASRG